MTGLRFEELPDRTGYASKWRTISGELRARPGEWAVVAVVGDAGKSGTTAAAVKRGVYAGMPKGEFEATARTVNGEHRVYARYIGGAQ